MVRELLTGNWFWGTLLFVTYVGFFPFTYLQQIFTTKKRWGIFISLSENWSDFYQLT
ncbi:hypothetical protein PN480_16735 [Dolichospermum circinale CS-1225]|nr:hypothetical protein [Dolichospermum circinale CS-1225]